MDELNELRRQIDQIDEQIVGCIEERMDCAARVAQYKMAHNLPVLDTSREAEVLKKRVNWLKNPELASGIKQVFTLLMRLSRARQQLLLEQNKSHCESDGCADGRIAFQGEPGANSEAAAKLFCGNSAITQNFTEFEDVFQAVQCGDAKYGILPIENSTTGSIVQVYDLLHQYELHIVGEQPLRVDHCLLANPGAKLRDITDVYSHEQALLQCREYLKKHRFATHPYYNTAVSAKYISEQADSTKAAIASAYAGSLYGLQVLDDNISDCAENVTRFIIIGKKAGENAGANKASISFVLEHKGGALAAALTAFAQCGLNMVKIESRPLQNRNFEYRFHVDFVGERMKEKLDKTLERHGGLFSEFRLLGIYRAAV